MYKTLFYILCLTSVTADSNKYHKTMKTIDNPSFDFEVVYPFHKVHIIDEIENQSFDKVVYPYPEMKNLRRRLTALDDEIVTKDDEIFDEVVLKKTGLRRRLTVLDDEIDDEIVLLNTGLRRRLTSDNNITVTNVVETICLFFLMGLTLFLCYKICYKNEDEIENVSGVEIV